MVAAAGDASTAGTVGTDAKARGGVIAAGRHHRRRPGGVARRASALLRAWKETWPVRSICTRSQASGAVQFVRAGRDSASD